MAAADLSSDDLALLRQTDPDVLEELAQLQRRLTDESQPLPPLESVVVWLNPVSLGERAEHRFGRRASTLELLRNLLTIAPLVWTWCALAAAVANVGALSAEHLVTGSRSLLDLWQANFDGLPRPWPMVPRFSDVALTDVGLLTLLAVVAALQHRAAEEAAARGRTLRRLVERRAYALLAEIERRRRCQEQQALRDSLKLALGDASQALRDVVCDVAAERVRLIDLATKREAEYGELVAVAANLRDGAQALAGHVAGLDAQAAALQGAAAAVNTAADALRGACTDLAGLRDDLKGVMADGAEHAHRIVLAVAAVLDAHGRLDERLAALREQFGGVQQSLEAQGVALAERQARLDGQSADRQEMLDRESAERGRLLGALADQIAAQSAALDRHVDTLLSRLPSARAIASELATAWAEAQRAQLAPLVETAAGQIGQLIGAVARLDAILADLHDDATAVRDALRGHSGAPPLLNVGETLGDGHA